MKFNVAQLLIGPTGEVREFELDDDIGGLDPLIVPRSNLVGWVKFTHAGQNILAEGRAKVDLELVCARCAEPFVQSVTVNVLEEFEPSIDAATGRILEATHEDPALIIDNHNMLDLSEVIRQNLILAMDQYPHCRQNCPGLCPQCGANLADGPCGCKEEPADARWSALEALRDKPKS